MSAAPSTAAHQAFLRYQQCPLKTRSAIISALRETLAPELATLAEESATETGMGNKEDKYLKNKAALENTPGIEDLTTSALTGDGGMVLFEYSPFRGYWRRGAQRQPNGNHYQQRVSACWRRVTASISAPIPARKRSR